jgi:hypothetical protein
MFLEMMFANRLVPAAPSLRTPEQPPNDSLRDEEDDDFGEPPGAVEAAPVADDADDFGNDFGDDFDEFEEGEVGGEDDFGDFDDGFQEGQGDTAFAESPPPPAPVPITPSIPVSRVAAAAVTRVTSIRILPPNGILHHLPEKFALMTR